MDQSPFLHHYTNIYSLGRILKTRKLRLNRLDQVDDATESEKFGDFDLARYLYVSCWTDSDEERIPLWSMYSRQMSGIRITLPRDPFAYEPLKPPTAWGTYRMEGEILSFLPFEKIFARDHVINSSFFFNKDAFIRKIEYLETDTLQKLRKDAVKPLIQPDGRLFWAIDGPQSLAGYKSKVWDFQAEVRYVLMLYPSPPLPKTGPGDEDWIKAFPIYMIQAMREGKGPDMGHLDLPLNQNALDNIKVTLGPLVTEANRLAVKDLLEKYTANGQMVESSLAGSVRRRT